MSHRRVVNAQLGIVALAATIVFVAAVSASSVAAQETLAASKRARIDSMVAQYMQSRHIPGASVAVAQGGRVVYAHAYGFADLENHVPASTNTRFQSASTLKVITATAVLRLAEQQRLDLDAPIERYCDAFASKPTTVTARLLLLHQGGIRPSTGADVFNRAHFATARDVVARFAGDSLVARPGTREVYSNEGYVLLACAIEGVTRKTYAEAIDELVLRPAGMRSTVVDDYYSIIPDRSRSYIVRTADNTKFWEGLWTPAHLSAIRLDIPANADQVDASWEWGAGNYLTTPGDLVRLAIALQSGAILSDSTARTMFANHPTSGGTGGRGYGWATGSLDGEASPRMIGSNWTGSSGVLLLPGRKIAVALSSNIEFEQPASLMNDIARIMTGAK